MNHFAPKPRPPLVDFAAAKNVGRDWYRVSVNYDAGNPGGPDHDIRVIATGKLYRIGDFTYVRLLNGAEPTPEDWREISEDGEPIDYPEDRACSAADRKIREQKEGIR